MKRVITLQKKENREKPLLDNHMRNVTPKFQNCVATSRGHSQKHTHIHTRTHKPTHTNTHTHKTHKHTHTRTQSRTAELK